MKMDEPKLEPIYIKFGAMLKRRREESGLTR